MKRINIGLPVAALVVAIAASSFTLPAKKLTDIYTYLQQGYHGTELLTTSSGVPGGWTDVTTAVDGDPLEYTDESAHCQLSDAATCVVQVYEGGIVEVYDGISQQF